MPTRGQLTRMTSQDKLNELHNIMIKISTLETQFTEVSQKIDRTKQEVSDERFQDLDTSSAQNNEDIRNMKIIVNREYLFQYKQTTEVFEYYQTAILY